MIKHIKTVLACLTVGLAVVSCNNNFDEDMDTISYPDNVELGMWQSTNSTVSYTVNITLNEAGDTICDVTTYTPSTGKANVIDGGAVSYDKRTGIITATYDESLYDTPARVTLTWKSDLSRMVVNIYSESDGVSSSKAVFNVEPATSISVYGDWLLADSAMVTLNADGTASYIPAGAEDTDAIEGTYTSDGSNVTVTLSDNTTITFTQNAAGQMYVSVAGAEAAYASHIMTQPRNDWYVYAYGTYSSWLFGDIAGCSLEYSPSRAEARIPDVIYPGSTLSFYWSIGESEATFTDSSFNTYYMYSQSGQQLGYIYFVPVSVTSSGAHGVYDNGVFTFGMSYQIPGVGTFGDPDYDYFTLDEVPE